MLWIKLCLIIQQSSYMQVHYINSQCVWIRVVLMLETASSSSSGHLVFINYKLPTDHTVNWRDHNCARDDDDDDDDEYVHIHSEFHLYRFNVIISYII